MESVPGSGKVRKRKAETQENERLSKRLSLLNLERNGQKLYVPVEQPSSAALSKPTTPPLRPQLDDTMQLDDTKHKVYIYDLDAELSDSDTSDDGRLVFLPDIQRHLRETRIPPMILANSDGELAGNNQLVLYNIPSSLTIPEEQDSVRKAIIESRARSRAKQQEQLKPDKQPELINNNLRSSTWNNGISCRDFGNGPSTGTGYSFDSMNAEPAATQPIYQDIADDDPDAMDIG